MEEGIVYSKDKLLSDLSLEYMTLLNYNYFDVISPRQLWIHHETKEFNCRIIGRIGPAQVLESLSAMNQKLFPPSTRDGSNGGSTNAALSGSPKIFGHDRCSVSLP